MTTKVQPRDRITLSQGCLRAAQAGNPLSYWRLRELVLKGEVSGEANEAGRWTISTSSLDAWIASQPRPAVVVGPVRFMDDLDANHREVARLVTRFHTAGVNIVVAERVRAEALADLAAMRDRASDGLLAEITEGLKHLPTATYEQLPTGAWRVFMPQLGVYLDSRAQVTA